MRSVERSRRLCNWIICPAWRAPPSSRSSWPSGPPTLNSACRRYWLPAKESSASGLLQPAWASRCSPAWHPSPSPITASRPRPSHGILRCCGARRPWQRRFAMRWARPLRKSCSSAASASRARVSVRSARFGASSTTWPAQAYSEEFVSGNYFFMFGINAFAGRVITPADDTPSGQPVAVMSYRAWQTHFGLDPRVIGSTFTINTMPYIVVGIAPPGFFGDTLRTDPPDFWLPLATEPALQGQNSILNNPGLHWLHVIGRLKAGASTANIQSEVTVELQRWLSARPDLTTYDRSQIKKQHITMAPGGAGVTQMQDQTKSGLRLLMIIAGLVLLIACANIANLFLARGAATRAETAIRVALGAPRRTLIRQILSESIL